ncbi:MAG: CpsD/CapB family tyrosine-protein kinase [Acidobacteriota bacterium]
MASDSWELQFKGRKAEFSFDESSDGKGFIGVQNAHLTETGRKYLAQGENLRAAIANVWASAMVKGSRRPKTLLICAATPGEGATITSFQLSLYLTTEYRMRVLYVDTGDEGDPAFQTDSPRGLATFFDSASSLESIVQSTEIENLWMLPSGLQRGRGGSIILRKERLQEFMGFCDEHFDAVIFDGSPILSAPSMIELGRAVDQVIFVCRYSTSRREVSQLAVEKLNSAGITISGVVLNAREFPVPPRFYNLVR